MRPSKWRALDHHSDSHPNQSNENSSSKFSSQSSFTTFSSPQAFKCTNPQPFSPPENELDHHDSSSLNFDTDFSSEQLPVGRLESKCDRSFSNPHLLHLHLFEEHSEWSKEQQKRGLPIYACVLESCIQYFHSRESRLKHVGSHIELDGVSDLSSTPTLNSSSRHSHSHMMNLLSELDGINWIKLGEKVQSLRKEDQNVKLGKRSRSELEVESDPESEAASECGSDDDFEEFEGRKDKVSNQVAGSQRDWNLEEKIREKQATADSLVESLSSLSLIPSSLRNSKRKF